MNLATFTPHLPPATRGKAHMFRSLICTICRSPTVYQQPVRWEILLQFSPVWEMIATSTLNSQAHITPACFCRPVYGPSFLRKLKPAGRFLSPDHLLNQAATYSRSVLILCFGRESILPEFVTTDRFSCVQAIGSYWCFQGAREAPFVAKAHMLSFCS